MPASLPNTLAIGGPRTGERVQANDEALRDYINSGLTNAEIAAALAGSLTKDDLATALGAVLGVSSTATVRRGKTITATEQAVTSTSYATLTTADQVSSVVLPTDGLIVVAYQALWKSSVSAAGRAAIFLGANQLKVGSTTVPIVQEASTVGTAYQTLASNPIGVLGGGAGDGTSFVTTGQVVGIAGTSTSGIVHIFADAGTYDVAVKFKSASGSVTAKERRLWVYTIGF